MEEVRIWEEEVVIPTYEVGKADKNPMFLEKRVYQGSSGKLYPYPTTEEISFVKTDKVWHACYLENEYLKVMVLPELGGRIQRALDKTNGYDFVYYNHVIKPALVGLAGPWISGGIEFNWPQHHRPTTYMPVDHLISKNGDGSMTLYCNDEDQMYGTKGILSFTLRPDRAYIEIGAQLYNATNLPQTFLWWANPAVAVNERTQSVFPTDVHFVMDHGKRDVSRFPIARGVYYKHDYSEGVDISRYKNIPVPTSYMAEKSAYDFVGGYDYGVQAGLLHVADHHISPGKKQWTWGCGEFGKAWDENLTDSDGPYIELMCGVYTDNQPDFTWLAPFEEKSFKQYFMPYKKAGLVKNATTEACVNLSLNADLQSAYVCLYATGEYKKASISLYVKDQLMIREEMSLSPGEFFEKTYSLSFADESEVRIEARDGERLLVAYQPEKAGIPSMPSPAMKAKKPEEIQTNEELLLTGEHIEQYRHATFLPDPYYLEALKRDPGDLRANNAYGLLLMRRGCFEEALPFFEASIQRAQMMTPNPSDSSAMYHKGLCLFYLSREEEAYDLFYKATWSAAQQEMSFYYLGVLAMRRGDDAAAKDFLKKSLVKNKRNIRARALYAACLIRLGETQKAKKKLKKNLKVDAFDYVSRFLALGLMEDGKEKAAEQDTLRILMRGFYGNYLSGARLLSEAGLYREALQFLAGYEGDSPLVDYYRGFFFEKSGDEKAARAFYEKAEGDSSLYCFPNRLEDIAILDAAILALDGHAAKASYYLGCLYYDKRQYKKAVYLWEQSAGEDPSFPTVHRNLAIAYYNKEGRDREAVEQMEQAFVLDTADARVFMEMDQLKKRTGESRKMRLSLMEAHKELLGRRDDLLIEYLTLMNSAGHYEEVYRGIMEHTFRPWEGGEGKVTAQYKLSLFMQALLLLKADRPKEAKERLERALTCPKNLGEGRLEGTKDNQIHYLLGCCLSRLHDEDGARAEFEAAILGQDEPAGVLYYYDQPADMILFKGLALQKLGRKRESCACFNKLLDYGERHLCDRVEDDYFAVSMPDFLLFETDMDKKNAAHCWYLMGLAAIGNGEESEAAACFEKTLEIENDHQNALIYQRIIGEGLLLS